ncbi:MAG: hypothetical protein IJ174_05800 [Clostridia bacterium]|nr:hypothetical protein [Clostridia bacterium]
MVSESQLYLILQPWFGSTLSKALYPAVQRILDRYHGYTEKQDLNDLYEWLRVLLFGEVRRITRATMIVELDSGDRVLLRSDDIDILADDLMYPLFETFRQDAAHCAILKAFAMENGSLSAYRALFMRYANWMDPAERSVMERVIRGFPRQRLYWYTPNQT